MRKYPAGSVFSRPWHHHSEATCKQPAGSGQRVMCLWHAASFMPYLGADHACWGPYMYPTLDEVLVVLPPRCVSLGFVECAECVCAGVCVLRLACFAVGIFKMRLHGYPWGPTHMLPSLRYIISGARSSLEPGSIFYAESL